MSLGSGNFGSGNMGGGGSGGIIAVAPPPDACDLTNACGGVGAWIPTPALPVTAGIVNTRSIIVGVIRYRNITVKND
jgi:hypothetical protein